MNKMKIYSYARFSSLLSLPFIALLPIFLLIGKEILFKNVLWLVYLDTVVLFIVSIILLIGYILIAKEKNNLLLIILLIISFILSIIDIVLGFTSVLNEHMILLIFWISSILSIIIGSYYIYYSKFFNYLGIVGKLVIIQTVLLSVYHFIPIDSPIVLNHFSIFTTFLGYCLIVVTRFFEFKLFSSLSTK